MIFSQEVYYIDLANPKGLRAEWRRSRQIYFEPWGDLFDRELEQFLAKCCDRLLVKP
ncbi:hypothetical protein QUB60_27060 [Microcoleus sp. A2-C5]|uniref:hypothetical protein n=1 Tax=unclassified Microcoleus TaxID=2642155 RepID=UPI002FCFF91A